MILVGVLVMVVTSACPFFSGDGVHIHAGKTGGKNRPKD